MCENKVSTDLDDLPGESWKDVPRFEGKYQVSNKGRLKSLSREGISRNGRRYHKPERILKTNPNTSGYLSTTVDNGVDSSGRRKVAVLHLHRLVAELFVSNEHSKPEVNHKDGVKTNNDVSNLEWVTPSENVKHAFDTGLAVAKKGIDANRAKIRTTEEVQSIKNEFYQGATARDVGSNHGLSPTEVSAIVKGKRFKDQFDQEIHLQMMQSRVAENKQTGLSHPRCKASAEVINQVAELYNNGVAIKELASRFGVDQHTMHRWLKSSWGADLPTNQQVGWSHSQTKLTPELYNKVQELRARGMSPNAIGRQLGFSRNTIVGWLTKDWCKTLDHHKKEESE